MPIKACRHIKKMRGGAQSHLIEGDDGCFYVVKFLNNPQHRRILVNELISSALLKYLRIQCPDSALIDVTSEFLFEYPQVSVNMGTKSIAPTLGRHFGSQFPGDPSKVAVYDFLPDLLLRSVKNLADFRGCLVFDKWVGNADARQSIFFRDRLRNWDCDESAEAPRLGFVARMIDHGFAFNGPHWDFLDPQIQGMYSRKLVYETVRSFDDLQPWLDQVMQFPEEAIVQAYKLVPAEWIEGDERALEKLLEALLRRRKRLPDLISGCRNAKQIPFPHWT
jgi:hypothetical protein